MFKGNAPPTGSHETHDRFIIIDRTEVYKVDTSVKDLGTAQSGIYKVEDDTVVRINKASATGGSEDANAINGWSSSTKLES